ncbi:MAG: hypothetical protein PF439_03715 [Helicobacteraceae bacterium]|jgi:hypothetical protein|nr:hypothetical protein [Helicobacteraceae bacterium]
MRVKKSFLTAVLLGVLTSVGQCESIAEPGPYIGLGLGYAMSDIDSNSIEEGLCGGSCVSYSDDENSLGFKLFGGYLRYYVANSPKKEPRKQG